MSSCSCLWSVSSSRLSLRWCLDWFHVRSSSSKGVTKRTRFDRLLKPRTPDDCPACRLASPPPLDGGPAPVRPWREVKSRRGAPKRIDTAGFACPNHQCLYFGITDAWVHASSGRWHAWPCRAHPDVSRPCLSHHLQCSTRYPLVSPENPFACRVAVVLSAASRRARPFRRRAGLWLSTRHDDEVAGSRWPARSDLARTLLEPSPDPASAIG
jgi:hypothetical protein